MEIKRKIIDITYYNIEDFLIFFIMLYTINPVFYISLEEKDVYYLIINFVLTLIILLLILGIFCFINYLYFKLTKKLNLEIEFENDYLKIYFKKQIKKIHYSDINMIFIRKNIFNSSDIIINFPTTNIRLRNIYGKSYIQDKNSVILSNVINYESIVNELKKRINFIGIDDKKSNILSYNFSFFRYGLWILYFVILFVIFYKIKLGYLLIVVLLIRIRRKDFKYKADKDKIKIFNRIKEIYILNGNYIKTDKNLILKIKNMDRLYEKTSLNFVPTKFNLEK